MSVSIYMMEAIGKDDVGRAAILVQPEADGTQRDQRLFQCIGMRKGAAVGNDGDHALALPVDPDDEVADQASPGLLPVWLRMICLHPGKEGCGDPVRRRHGIGAGGRGDHGMAPRGVEPEDRLIRTTRAGQGGLVPVGGGFFHSDHRRDVRFYTADPAKAILHLLPLGGQGGFIAHMAAGAPAAAGIGRAAGIPPIGRRYGRRHFHPAEGIALFGFDDPDGGLLAGKETGNENGKPFMTAYALQVRAEVVRGQDQAVIFLHPLRFLPIILYRPL